MSECPDYSNLMQVAIDLAARGQFAVCPNPTVGALLVRDGQILAQGWHHAFGAPHAEIDCLDNARRQGIPTQGATLIVTLEPCTHHGKTPPCTEAIVDAGISTLVYGCRDPNKKASGGSELLREKGVTVIGPVLERECQDLIADFTIWQTTSRPYVILKLASTLDGRIATRTGNSRWISNEISRATAHELRSGIGKCGGAILIGGGTFRADNPMLSARTHDAGPQPLAAILTSRLPRADSEFALLTERAAETIFFASPAATASTGAERLRKLGCRVIAIGPTPKGVPDFANMFQILRNELGCWYILCEGGGQLALSLLEASFIDEFHLFMAPIILGDDNAKPLFKGRAPLSIEDALRMRLCSVTSSAGDAHLILRPK